MRIEDIKSEEDIDKYIKESYENHIKENRRVFSSYELKLYKKAYKKGMKVGVLMLEKMLEEDS